MRIRRTLTALFGLALTVPLAATAAQAGEVVEPPGPTGRPDVVVRGLLSPLSLDVAPGGTAWYSQNFAGQLLRKRTDRPAKVVYRNPRGAEVGAVSKSGRTVTFAITGNRGRTALKEWSRADGIQSVANLSHVESNRNPDRGNTYGIVDLDEGCTQEQIDDVPPFMRPYTGIVESHPYASLTMGGMRYVADAAANAIFRVNPAGQIRTLAVLPPQPTEITAEAAAANGLPDCTVGKTFNFEPVPTDVERGPDGMLYVTTLPGGPEDPSLGARGAVHRIDPANGDLETVATGLLSATGLAVAPNGDLYVAELFGNRISRIPAGESSPDQWARAGLPGDVEYGAGGIWATRKVLTGLDGGRPAGQVVRYEGGVPR